MSHRLSLKLFLALLLLSYLSYSQDFPVQNPTLPEIMPGSPTVGNLMHFEEVPIDHYTGQPDISVPIFSKKIHGNLNFNLALKYSTLGLKIQERSGWTGTGWSLEIGGVVSRTVRGFPDENTDWKTLGIYHNDDFWNYDNLTDDERNEFNWNAIGSRAKHNDTELDIFQFTLLGETGRFVVVKEGDVLKAKLLSINKHLKIDLVYDPLSYQISSFTITDIQGYKYFFNQIEITGTTSYPMITQQGSAEGFAGQPENRNCC